MHGGLCPNLHWSFVGNPPAELDGDLAGAAGEEVAAAEFAQHVVKVTGSTQARERDWAFTAVDPLLVVVTVTATDRTAVTTPTTSIWAPSFFDAYPPTTSFASLPREAAPGLPARDGWTPGNYQVERTSRGISRQPFRASRLVRLAKVHTNGNDWVATLGPTPGGPTGRRTALSPSPCRPLSTADDLQQFGRGGRAGAGRDA
ncbi:hypothetical protein [Amycolatopsis sp. NPDC051371]|uniref:hypothetical protein n=1 Tax=Amycolatopsis sp. NPDC051371 TaxID=3155800 RepID=UPI003414DF59